MLEKPTKTSRNVLIIWVVMLIVIPLILHYRFGWQFSSHGR
jgi:hypothetical protein